MSQAPTETAPVTETPAGEAPPTGTETPNTPAAEASEVEGDETDPRVQRANRQAAQYRTQLRETQQQLAEIQAAQESSNGVLDALRRALTGETNTEADPAEVAQRLTSEVDTLRTTNQQLQAELQVHALAGEHGANPTALLDSRSFTTALHGLDPSAEDYRDQVAEAIRAAVNGNQNLRAGQVPPGRGGAETAGQGAGNGSGPTQEEFNSWAYAQRAELFQSNPDLYRRLAGAAT